MSAVLRGRVERLERQRSPEAAPLRLSDEAWAALLANLGLPPGPQPPAPASGAVGEDGLTDEGRRLLADLLAGMAS